MIRKAQGIIRKTQGIIRKSQGIIRKNTRNTLQITQRVISKHKE